MNKIILSILLVLLCQPAYAVTTYTLAICTQAGLTCDYTSLATAVTTNVSNLSTSLVIDGSLTRGALTGALSQTTSGASGTFVSKTATQMLIKTVSGTPNATGTWYPTADGDDTTNAWTPTTAGDSVRIDFNIQGTWASNDTSCVYVDGYTSSATNYLKIFTSGAARHQGKKEASPTYYRLICNTYTAHGIAAYDNGITIDGLHIETYNTASCIRLNASNLTVKNNLLSYCSQYGLFHQDGGAFTIYNNIIYGTGNNPMSFYRYAMNVYNNTLIGNMIMGYDDAGQEAKNNIVIGGIGNVSYFVTATNATSDNSGTVGMRRITRNIFVNSTSGSEDLRLSTGFLVNAGTDLGASYNTDMVGNVRSGAWDLGAIEYQHTGSLGNDALMQDAVYK